MTRYTIPLTRTNADSPPTSAAGRQVRRIGGWLLGIALVGATACKKFITIDPPRTRLITATVFQDEATATAAMMGIYTEIAAGLSYDLSLYPGLSADEFLDYSNNPINREFMENALLPTNNVVVNNGWAKSYKLIYQANALLEGVQASAALSASVARQLTGEARFLRSFLYFYLVNWYGDVPLILSTDWQTNRSAPRRPKEQVYQQLIADLMEAKKVLGTAYVDGQNAPTLERVRPNGAAVAALLARVYLFTGQWALAEAEAGLLIGDPRYQLPGDLEAVFGKDSPEAIWQLQPVGAGYNTLEGNQFILTGLPQTVALRPSLVAGFDQSDQRKNSWIGHVVVGNDTFYFPFKYKVQYAPPTEAYAEYVLALRLGEQYLIRAESRAQQGQFAGALADLNVVHQRAGLPAIGPLTQSVLLQAIATERQHELFSEWGHRWLDLNRTGQSAGTLAPIKSGWQATDQRYPIPLTDIQDNPGLTQNDGY